MLIVFRGITITQGSNKPTFYSVFNNNTLSDEKNDHEFRGYEEFWNTGSSLAILKWIFSPYI